MLITCSLFWLSSSGSPFFIHIFSSFFFLSLYCLHSSPCSSCDFTSSPFTLLYSHFCTHTQSTTDYMHEVRYFQLINSLYGHLKASGMLSHVRHVPQLFHQMLPNTPSLSWLRFIAYPVGLLVLRLFLKLAQVVPCSLINQVYNKDICSNVG